MKELLNFLKKKKSGRRETDDDRLRADTLKAEQKDSGHSETEAEQGEKHFGSIPDRSRLNDHSPYKVEEKVCGHCGTEVKQGQKYCEYCGQSVLNPVIKEIEYRGIQIVYGPPPACAEVECKSCGTKWTAYRRRSCEDNKRYCPQCGDLIEVNKFVDFYEQNIQSLFN